jgi:hypothetical protein
MGDNSAPNRLSRLQFELHGAASPAEVPERLLSCINLDGTVTTF